MLVNSSFSNKDVADKKSDLQISSSGKLKRMKKASLLEKKWKNSKFVISYNCYRLENRSIESLKLKMNEYFKTDSISFGIFKNSLIRKVIQKNFFDKENHKDLNIFGNSLLIFVSNECDVDIFSFLSKFKDVNEEFSSEIRWSNSSSDKPLEFNDRLNWAFVDNKFENSSELILWSKFPNKNVLLVNLISSLMSNLITFTLCLEKVVQSK